MSNGAGSPRAGVYADCTDEQMQDIRRQEQRLQDKNTTESQRREARDRIRYLDFEQSRLRRTLQDQERLAP